ncbi:MAG: class I SAM-dependent methyltransferase [Deltaproteobacteria bacterium]|nr:class I SAM-dependent methyltransferase [Deltaproteobacteria bacterium]
MQLIEKVIQKLRRAGFWETLRYLPHWLHERFYEWRFGIDSAGYLNVRDTGLEGATDPSGSYEPSSYRDIFRALGLIKVNPQQDVFLDYGSGKGRAVIVAATYPFKRVIGVELSPELNAVARQNLKRAARRLRCRQVEIVTADAMQYQLPDDVTVVFLYGPFFGEPLQAVITQLNQSLRRVARPLSVIYRYPQWTDDPFQAHPGFELLKETSGYTDAGERVRIYRSR